MTAEEQAKRSTMLERVRKLLAKAEAEGVTAEEAELYTAKAAELMARYGIDKAMADARAKVNLVPGNKVFTIDEPYASTKVLLMSAIARALHCDTVLIATAGPKSRIHVFGFESELEQAGLLYTSLLLQMAHAVNRYPLPAWLSGRRLMAERRSVMLGFIGGVSPILEAAYSNAVSAADAADATGTPGTALVLRSREIAVQDALRKAYPKTRKVSVSYRGGGYDHGYEAGSNANVHNRDHVGSGSRALGR